MALEYIIEEVDVQDIVPDYNQPRKYYDLVHINEIADSVASNGILKLPIVEKLKGRERKLVIGHQRWLGALIAGASKIYVRRVVGELTQLQRLEIQIHEDSQEAFLPWVRAQNYHKLWLLKKEKHGEEYTLQTYCKEIGRCGETVRNAFAYSTNLVPELKTSVMEGHFDYTPAKEVARVKVPMPKLEELGLEIKDNSLAYLNDLINTLKEQKDEQSQTRAKKISALVERTKYEQIRIAQWIKQKGKKLSRPDLETRIARANQELKEEKFEFKIQKVKEGIPKYVKQFRSAFDDTSDIINKILVFSRLEPEYRGSLLKSEYSGSSLVETISDITQNIQSFENNVRKYSTLLNRLETRAKETFQDVRTIDSVVKFALEENKKKRKTVSIPSLYKVLIKDVPVEQIAEDEENPRGDNFDPEGLKNIANSIKEYGLFDPILIRNLDKKIRGMIYKVTHGTRRYRSVRYLLKRKTIETFLQNKLSKEAILTLQIIEDSQKAWTMEERAGAWSKYYSALEEKKSEKLTLKEFSKKIGKSHGTVKKALAFDTLLNKKVKEMCLQDLITYSSATLISAQEREKQYAFALESALGSYKIPTLRKRIRREQMNRHNLKLFKEDKKKFREGVFSEFGQKTTAHLFFLNKTLEKILEQEQTAIFKDEPVVNHFFKLKKNLERLDKHLKRINL